MAANSTAGTDEFVALRSLLFSLAYRMTGSVADAEDIVSEAYLRLRRAQAGGTQISSLKTYLCSVVTRLSIDHLRSARMRREAYVGPWLPEPLVQTESTAEFERVELADTLSMGAVSCCVGRGAQVQVSMVKVPCVWSPPSSAGRYAWI